MKTETICSMLWNHQFIDGTSRVKPCCRFRGSIGTFSNDLDETFSSYDIDIIRNDMLAGKRPAGCIRCWQEEDSGKKSLRQRYNENPELGINQINFKQPVIQWLELAISNDCNLMCRMCDSRYSHLLFNEELEFQGKTYSKKKNTKINVDAIFKYVPYLKHLKITGGEPLVTPDHWKLINYIIETGYAKNIWLNYSTNLTIFPRKKFIDRWKHFKFVEIASSFDSCIPEETEYLRYPSKQEDVYRTIGEFLNLSKTYNIRVQSRPTITILNIYHLPETLEWLYKRNIKFNATHLTYPQFLSITILPMKDKLFILDKFNNFKYSDKKVESNCKTIAQHMMNEDNTDLLDRFLEYTMFLDKKRNQSFKKTYSYYSFV